MFVVNNYLRIVLCGHSYRNLEINSFLFDGASLIHCKYKEKRAGLGGSEKSRLFRHK